jgi:hypothetical protein
LLLLQKHGILVRISLKIQLDWCYLLTVKQDDSSMYSENSVKPQVKFHSIRTRKPAPP